MVNASARNGRLMVSTTDRCRVCNEPLTPGAGFCPHCGTRVQHDIDEHAAKPGRVDNEKSRGSWVLVTAIVAVVAIALASTSGGGGGNPPGSSVSPATPTTSARTPVTPSRPPATRTPTSPPGQS